jgi:multiple sugar transport system substrate-binding protein
MGKDEGEDGDAGSADQGEPAPGGRASPPLRMAATDLAILVAFCRPYTAGQRFPSPAPNNKILEELAADGVYMDLDSLRGHLRHLYARFGVEEGLTPAEKRVRLVELIYDNDVIPGWGKTASEQAPPPAIQAPDVVPPEPSKTAGDGADPARGALTHRLLATPARYRWAAAGLAAALIVLSGFAIIDGASGVKVIDPGSIRDAAGKVTYCTGKDVVRSHDGRTSQHADAVRRFNDEFDPHVHVDLYQLPRNATQQFNLFSARQRERSDLCDVFYSDVTWTAEFAHDGWLYDLSPYVEPRLEGYVPAMRKAAFSDGRYWGVPKQADAGLLFYDTDTVPEPPSTWQQLYRQAARPPGNRFRYQGRAYEGLTVNFLELAYAAGATDIITPDHKAHINQPKAVEALQLMADGIKSGAVPRTVLTEVEEDNLYAFGEKRRKRADFMRNWPYVYRKLENGRTYADVAGHVGVSALPRWGGRKPASVLGGHILVISAFTKNPGAALKLVDYLSSRAVIKRDAVEFGLAPALADLWNDPDVQAALPVFGELKRAIYNARPRPITPNYQKISQAIYTNVNDALTGDITPAEALDAANDAIQQALDDAYG